MEGNYVERAENVIKNLKNKKIDLTTSKIRNILSMVSDLYNDAQRLNNCEKLSDEMYMRTQYLKMRLAYEAGRDKITKDFIEKAELIEEIDNIKKSKTALLDFCHYVEALVAYHKYYIAKEI